METTLKQRLLDHYNELWGEFDKEEIEGVIEIAEGLEDDLSDMSQWNETLLLRMINNDRELYLEVANASNRESLDDILGDKDPFDV